MVRGTTKTGFVFEADENVMATWKVAKAIAKTQSDEGAEQLAGAVELVEDILGKKQEKAAKVITIPTDRTYQQGFRAEKREEPEADSEYMSRQAENALKKLRAIGG